MSDKVVTFAKEGHIGTLTLDRPPANSYELTFMQDMDAAISAAEADEDVRVVIIKSASEKFFCAGADIKAFMENDTAGNMKMISYGHEVLDRMAASRKIYIAAIAGHALGGGLEICLAADLRFASEGKYYMGLPEVALGILPGNGGTQRLPRLIGQSKALEMMITGERVDPATAHALGIVNQLFPAESFMDDVMAYATRLASGASYAVGNIKRATYDGGAMDLADGLKLERDLIEELYNTEDSAEGIAAFVEKRKAVFKGK